MSQGEGTVSGAGQSSGAEAVRLPDPYALLGLNRNAIPTAKQLREAAIRVEHANPEGSTSVAPQDMIGAQYRYAVMKAALSYVEHALEAMRGKFFTSFKFSYDAATGDVLCFNHEPARLGEFAKLLASRGIDSRQAEMDSKHGLLQIIRIGAVDIIQSDLAQYLPPRVTEPIRREEKQVRDYVEAAKPSLITSNKGPALIFEAREVTHILQGALGRLGIPSDFDTLDGSLRVKTSATPALAGYLPADLGQKLRYEYDMSFLKALSATTFGADSGKHGAVRRMPIEGKAESLVQRGILTLARHGVEAEVVPGSDGKLYLQISMASQQEAWNRLQTEIARHLQPTPDSVIDVDGVKVLPPSDVRQR